MDGQWFRKSLQKKVYAFYLKGIPTEYIASHLNLREDDVNDIIDYINELYH